jgi:hypothetical protein
MKAVWICSLELLPIRTEENAESEKDVQHRQTVTKLQNRICEKDREIELLRYFFES